MKNLTLNELITEFKKQPDCEEYIAHSGRKCFSTVGNYDWYLLKCAQMNIEPTAQTAYSATARGNGFLLEYASHSIVLALDSTEGGAWIS